MTNKYGINDTKIIKIIDNVKIPKFININNPNVRLDIPK